MKIIKLIFKIPAMFLFLIYYSWEVVLSNIEVAKEVLSLKIDMTPGIVAIPLATKKPFIINMLANLITMTPGTMSLEVDQEKNILYVYALHIDDVEKFKKKIKTSLEHKIIKLFG